MDDHRPLIGIVGLLELEPEPSLRLANRYADAVLRAGGLPLAIPPVGGPADLERLVGRLDGLLFSGGDDFDTQRLGLGPTHGSARPVPAAKQDLDFALARAALAAELPVLGICYGMQLLALAEGGTLHQHLPEDRPGARPHARVEHDVLVEPSSRLGRVLALERLSVVSRHHQAVATLGTRWSACAHDEEGLIEAIESPSRPFALGVQWHPELSPEGSAHNRLLRAFVGSAALRASRAAVEPRGARARERAGR